MKTQKSFAKGYKFFVVNSSTGDVVSGWEYIDDAADSVGDEPLDPDDASLTILRRAAVDKTKLAEFIARNS